MRWQWIALLLCSGQLAVAQEQLGLSHSNYMPLEGGLLNPARYAGQWPYADLRVLGVGLNIWNDLVALSGSDHSLVGEIRNGLNGTSGPDPVLRTSFSERDKKATTLLDLRGPAASISMGRGTFGFSLRSRAALSVTGVPASMGRFMINGLNHAPQRGVRYRDDNIRQVMATWNDASIHYARIVQASGFGMLSAGASVSYRMGHAAAILRFDELDYTILDTMRAVVHGTSGTYTLAMPGTGIGRGWGADLGVSYERTFEEVDRYLPHRSSTGCKPMGYRYRLGLSIIDLGGMQFRDVQGGAFSGTDVAIDDHQALSIEGTDELDSLLRSDMSTYRPVDRIRLGAPTALSIQYDHRLREKVYIGTVWVQQISSPRGTRIRRPNTLAISPRFETRVFEAALPITIREYDLRRPMIGLMMRFNNLVLGSDHIVPLFTRQDIHAVDVYAMLRINMHRSPFCRGRRRSNRSHAPGSMEQLPCILPQ
ncbi:MAG: hypothetical protein KDB88_05315 [Flavobacteriales bacterium]|nr:hypothetical protein [Flavobacteriales bacterium]